MFTLVASILVPAQASAAACCVSATSFGVGRLLIWEEFAAGLQVGHSRILGQWDAGGSFMFNDSSYAEGVTFVQPWAIVRAQKRIQLQAWVPIIANDRRTIEDSQAAGGVGDVGAAARFELFSIGEYHRVPAVAFTVGASAPTGRRVEDTSPPLFAGTTGRGAWGGSFAIETEYAFLPWFVKLDAGATGFLPFDRSDTGQSQQYGPTLQSGLSGGRELIPDVLVGALALNFEWEDSMRLDGAVVPSSAARLLSIGASIAWRVESHWTLTGNVFDSVWMDGVGSNRDGRFGFTLGVRYGYF